MANLKEIFKRRKRNADEHEHSDAINMKIFKTNAQEHFAIEETNLGQSEKIITELEEESEKWFDIEELSQSNLLSKKIFDKLADKLPSKTNCKKLDLIYSSFNHGFSLQTLYRRSRSWALRTEAFDEITPSILVISDFEDNVFGAFSTSLPKIRSHRFIGTGESFVFTLKPKLTIYSWSERNEYFMNCGKDYLTIGGSNKSKTLNETEQLGTALWIDDDLKFGRSMKCETFNSDILSSEEDFKIAEVELWTFK
uniref:nuclear receptor coactivator 7-like n=1 Tax=Styela clava TaxID=7725 RepID=UPI00193973A7|nr:nuclear receptor coactivator 7-like [Styela clava]